MADPKPDFTPNPAVARKAGDLYRAFFALDRDERLLHREVEEIIGAERHSPTHAAVIARVKKMLEESERGVTLECDVGEGYRLLTAEEQLDVTLRRQRLAQRQYRRAKKSVDALPAADLDDRQRRRRAVYSEKLAAAIAEVDTSRRYLALIRQPREGRNIEAAREGRRPPEGRRRGREDVA